MGSSRTRAAHRCPDGDATQPQRDEHPVLRLQQAAGNTAVQRLLAPVRVQRQLKVTGKPGDITTMLGLLGPPTGLKLVRDPKTTVVTGTSSGKPTSPALQAALSPILADPKQHAEVNLRRDQPGVWVGERPADNGPLVQELRIDQIAALEKHSPGDGVASLAHEIVENFVGHGQHAVGMGFDFGTSHAAALKTENTVLGELQAAQKVSPSGARQNTYKVTCRRCGNGPIGSRPPAPPTTSGSSSTARRSDSPPRRPRRGRTPRTARATVGPALRGRGPGPVHGCLRLLTGTCDDLLTPRTSSPFRDAVRGGPLAEALVRARLVVSFGQSTTTSRSCRRS